MKEKQLDEDLRLKINEFLESEYEMSLPSSVISIMDAGTDYLYINNDPNTFIYIPKKAVRQI